MEPDTAILQEFERITLEEMENVKLMNRTDTKFVFNIGYFDKVMKEAAEHYRILEIAGNRLCRYETLYYDTSQFHLYRQHHQGKLNRYKVRHRTYVDSDTGYLEVKFKNNKGRTIKTRIKQQEVPLTWEGAPGDFLGKTLPFQPSLLQPVIWINYQRFTLVNKISAERVTVDVNLEFIQNDKVQKLANIVIAEVKQDKRLSSPFLHIMKKYHLRDGSISKYCLGMAMSVEGIKKNNFKSKILSIQHKNI